MKLPRRLRLLAKPALVLPVVLAAALLTVAIRLGNLGDVVRRVREIPLGVVWFVLGMGAVYLVLKLLQFRWLLANLGLHPRWRRLLLAFAVGELAVTLPFGIFSENWVLSTAGGPARFGHSSAATVVMLMVEMLAVLLLLAIVGIPRWPELRPIAAICAIGLLAVVFSVPRFKGLARRLALRSRRPMLQRAAREARGLLRGLARLLNARVLTVNVMIAAAYLGALVFAFMQVGHGVGLQQLTYLTAASIYAFSLAVVLMGGGLISQIGTVEILGMHAGEAWGLSFNDGLALMLGFRLLWTGAMWLFNLPVVLFLWPSLHREFRQATAAEEVDEEGA